VLEVAVPDAGERPDVAHEGRSDVDLAVLADGHGLAVASGVVHLDAGRVPAAGRDLENDLRVAHQVAVQHSVVGDGDQLAAARPSADVFNNQPHEAGHSQADRPGPQRGQAALPVDDSLNKTHGFLLLRVTVEEVPLLCSVLLSGPHPDVGGRGEGSFSLAETEEAEI
jgi:hypothetical protein